MAHICQVHPYEAAEGLCRSCGGPFCADCLVYPFGPVKPPYCVPCAVTAAGVRKSARNPTVAVPKETKQRLKEWRKARKRDLASPPPDGVGTWQRMDEADSAVDEVAVEAQAAAEREALRLPPPEPETPTPPAGVNLAPPGPAGTDWRGEVASPATDVGAPGPRTDHGPADLAAFGIGPDPAFNAPAEATGWAPPTDQVPVALPEPAPVPAATPDPPVPAASDTFTPPTNEATPFTPSSYEPPTSDTATPPTNEATPFTPSSYEPPTSDTATPPTNQPTPFTPSSYEPPTSDTFTPPANQATPFTPSSYEPPTSDTSTPPANQATPFTPSPFGSTPLQSTPFEVKPLEGAPFEATPFEATPFEPGAFETTPFEPAAFEVPAFEATPVEPAGPSSSPVAFDPAPDPPASPFGTPAPTTTELPTSFGMGDETLPRPEPAAFDPLPPPPPAASYSFDPLPEAGHDPFAPLLSAGPTAFDPLPPAPPAAPYDELRRHPRSPRRRPCPPRIGAGDGHAARPPRGTVGRVLPRAEPAGPGRHPRLGHSPADADAHPGGHRRRDQARRRQGHAGPDRRPPYREGRLSRLSPGRSPRGGRPVWPPASASVMANISTTSRAAFIDPSMATVATGMPRGIWTVA